MKPPRGVEEDAQPSLPTQTTSIAHAPAATHPMADVHQPMADAAVVVEDVEETKIVLMCSGVNVLMLAAIHIAPF